MNGAYGRRPLGDRPIELLAVLLLGVATVGSAWCGFQAARWNNEETELVQQATEARIESSRLFGLATQLVSYDTNTVAQYAQATAAGDERLKTFYRETLIRPEFLPVLDAWEAQIAAGGEAPENLIENEEYIDSQFADYTKAEAEADQISTESRVAGDNANEFVALTLVLASSLFFAGITTQFRNLVPRLLLLTGASVLVAYGAARLVDLPMA